VGRGCGLGSGEVRPYTTASVGKCCGGVVVLVLFCSDLVSYGVEMVVVRC
jgi:hypothetical protein